MQADGSWRNPVSGDNANGAINAQNGDVQYAGYLSRTEDRWSGSTDIYPAALAYETNNGSSRPYGPPTTPDPNNSAVLYIATAFLHRLTDSGGQSQSWDLYLGNQCLAGQLPPQSPPPSDPGMLKTTGQFVNVLAVAPGDSKRIYTGSTDCQLWMSTHAGKSGSWRRIGSGSFPSSGPITAISVNPAPGAQNDIVVGIAPSPGISRLWRCTNTDAPKPVWADVTGAGQPYALPDIPVNAVVRTPWRPDDSWFVGTDIGVFYTGDAGQSWINVTQPYRLPNVPVKDLFADPVLNCVYAATWGRGIWQTEISAESQPLPPPHIIPDPFGGG